MLTEKRIFEGNFTSANQTDCGNEHYSTVHQFHSQSIVSQHFMEQDFPLRCSQELSTFPYPESDKFSTHHPILAPQDPS
jgi:hypothetical protein